MIDITSLVFNSELYFSRKGIDLFISAIMLRSESVELEMNIGLGFDYTILRMQGYNHYFVSKNRDAELVKKLEDIFNNQPAFFHNQADIISTIYDSYPNYISNFKNKNIEELKTSFNEDYTKIAKDLMYTTSMPYLVLKLVEKNPEKYTELSNLFTPLRGKSLYQDITSDIVAFWLSLVSKETELPIHEIESISPNSILSYFNGKELEKEDLHSNIESQPTLLKFNSDLGKFDISFECAVVINKFLNDNGLLIVKSFKGNTAFRGKTKGRVKIVNSKDDELNFQKGDILVSINTNPSIISSVTKCAAIITDEGGVTSHAAIVSRELGIPCIINTKIATKALKDGDLVEVDANNGVVRVLERSD